MGNKRKALELISMAAALGAFSDFSSSYTEPEREPKTKGPPSECDLERLAKAEAKRERKRQMLKKNDKME